MTEKRLAPNLDQFLEFYTQELKWEVFPIKPREKSPPLCKWQMEASRNLEKVLEWWKQYPDANIGLRCGVTSSVVVIDVDPNHTGDESLLELFSKYQNFPDTPLCLSGGGGRHFFFKHPIDVRIPSRNGQLAVGIDVKADGGYVVLPPSVHPSGKRYEWEISSPPSKVDLPPLPIWLFDLIREEPKKGRDFSKKGSLPLDEDEPFVSGTRNEMLTSLAGSMRRRGMSQQAIFQGLKAENIKRCVPPLPDDEVALIAESVSRYKPKDVPRTSKMVVSNRRSQLEWLFCASVYHDTDLAVKKAGWLEPSCIATDKLRKFWERVREGDKNKTEVANDLGILSDLTAWTAHISTVNEVESLAQQVSRNSYIDNVAENLTQLTQAVSSADVEKTRHIISVMGESIPSIGREVKTAVQGLDEFKEMLEDIDERALKTRLDPIDDVLGGLERQTLTIIGARPGGGKTTLAWQIARGVAVGHKRVVFHSLEMSAKALWAKAVSGVSETRWRDVRGGKVSDETLKNMLTTADELKNDYGEYLLVDDSPATVDAIWQVTSKYSPDLVIVDHLRLLKDFGGGQMREDKRLGYVSQRLKDLAKFFNIPVICLAQLNRSVEGRDNKQPQMSDLRDSGQIEENADNVLMLYPKDYYELQERSAYSEKEYYETQVLFRKIRDDRLGQHCIIYFSSSQGWFYPYEVIKGKLSGDNGGSGRKDVF